MDTLKFGALGVYTEDIQNLEYFVGTKLISGTRGMPDAVYQDFLFTPEQIINSVLQSTQKKFQSPSTGNTITLSWFNGKNIGTLTFNNQSFFSEENFTQDGDTITLLNGLSVITGQLIKADTI